MADNTNIQVTIEAWADIVIKQWLFKIDALNISDTWQLYNSFIHHIVSNSGGDVSRIEFAFLYYGKFVDMGVGSGVTIQDVGIDTVRKPQVWYSKIMYSQVKRLAEILGEKYARKSQIAIIEGLDVNETNK